MRSRVRASVFAIALLASIGFAVPSLAFGEVSFEFFASNLNPYGSWHVSANYGRVWLPSVEVSGWHPYENGYWVYTDYGWTWVSEYEWGAIPFHYGTWVIEPGLGWVWVPGYVWAPAWIVYRTGPNYIGWAPVPPSFSIGVSFASYDYTPEYFVFVRERDFCEHDLRRRALPADRVPMIYQQTTVINNIAVDNHVVVNRGLDVRQVERVAARRPERLPIERVPRVAPIERVSREALRVDPRHSESGHVRVVDAQRQPPDQRPEIEQRDWRGRNRTDQPNPEPGVQPNPAPSVPGDRERAQREQERAVREQRDRAAAQQQEHDRARAMQDQRDRAAQQEHERAQREQERVRKQQARARQDQERAMQHESDRAAQQEQERAQREQERARQQQEQQERAQEMQQRARQEHEQAAREQQQRAHEEEQRARQEQQRQQRERARGAEQQGNPGSENAPDDHGGRHGGRGDD